MTRPVAVVEAELLESEDARKIAAALGLPIEAYVAQVLAFAAHPDREPSLHVVEEDDAEAEGLEMPTTAEVHGWLSALAAGEAGPKGTGDTKDGFAREERAADRLFGRRASTPTARSGRGGVVDGGDERLRAQVERMTRPAMITGGSRH